MELSPSLKILAQYGSVEQLARDIKSRPEILRGAAQAFWALSALAR